MPGYLKVLMGGAVVLLTLGLVGHAKNRMEQPPPAPTAQTSVDSSKARGFVSGAPEAQSGDPAMTAPAPKSTWSGTSTKVGAGFLLGFIVGWIFRFFLKTMALLTGAGALILGGLSCFNVVNVDLTTTKTEYDNAMAWVKDQGERLTHVIYDKMNATVPTGLGAFFGFRRRS
jgi:uncharacterized membrane protein (Fun14 family)